MTTPAGSAPASDPSCPFCRIVAGTEPAHVVLDDDVSLAFLDTRRAQLLSGLAEKKQIDDQIKTDLDQALTEFGQTFGAAQKTAA